MKQFFLFLCGFLPLSGLAQWQQCNTPYHGLVNDLESFDNYIWASTTSGGVYRINNQNSNWQEMNQGLNSVFDKQAYFLKNIGNTLYLATRGALYKRISNASYWTNISSVGYPVNDINGVNNILIACRYGEIIKSVNTGTSWNPVTIGLPATGTYNPRFLCYNYAGGDFFVAIDGVGIYRSTDYGNSWSPVSLPIGVSSSSPVSMIKNINNDIYMAIENLGLYKWNYATSSWQTEMNIGFRLSDLAILNNRYVFAGGTGLLLSQGTSYTLAVADTPSFFPATTSVEIMDNVVYAGSIDDGAFKMDSAFSHLEYLKEGMKAASIQFISGNGTTLLTHANRQHYIWHSSNEFTSADASQTDLFLWDDFHDDFSDAQRWYVVTSGRGIMLSYDNGSSFKYANNNLPNTFQSYKTRSILNTSAGYLICGTSDGQFYRTVNDSTWAILSDLNSPNESIVSLINAGNYLFAGTKNTDPTKAHIYRSADNGQTWNILPGPFQSGREVFGLTYDNNRLIAGSSGYGTFYSIDFGNSWNSLDNGLPASMVFSKLKSFNGRDYAIGQLDNKIYELVPNDTVWNCLNDQSGDPFASDVFFQNGTLFLGTPDHGIYKWPSFITSLAENKKSTNATLFPNPSSECIIIFTNVDVLPKNVSVAELSGKIIFQKNLSGDFKQLKLDGRKYAKGIYMVSVEYNNSATETYKWVCE